MGRPVRTLCLLAMVAAACRRPGPPPPPPEPPEDPPAAIPSAVADAGPPPETCRADDPTWVAIADAGAGTIESGSFARTADRNYLGWIDRRENTVVLQPLDSLPLSTSLTPGESNAPVL